MRFNFALDSQIKDIYSITESFDLSKGNSNERGFLVSSFTLEQYNDFFKDPRKHLYVSTVDNKVMGFIYGYYVDDGEDSESLKTYKDLGAQGDFVVKQICVHPDSPKGTGTFLMSKLFKIIDGDIYLAIVSDPLNIPSLLFHKKMGFVETTRITENDGLGRIIMVRYCNQELKSFSNVGLAQYQTAVDLYKHEDHLTWTKFNFSIITNGAILSILIPNITSEFNRPLFIFLVSVVVLINVGYIYTIRLGRIYLQKRKNDAIVIEERLQHLGMGYIIKSNGSNEKLNKILANSLTRYVQYSIPMLFTIGWLVMLFLFLKGNI